MHIFFSLALELNPCVLKPFFPLTDETLTKAAQVFNVS